MTSITIEKLDQVLESEHITVLSRDTVEYFDRRRDFEINGEKYSICWNINICYLYSQGEKLTIPFNHVKITNTWPNKSRMNIQFYNSSKDVVCILVLVEV